MKNLLLRASVVVLTSNMKISRRRLADYLKNLHQKACCTCSTIMSPHSTNQIIDSWRCRCLCHFLNSLKALYLYRDYSEDDVDNSENENHISAIITRLFQITSLAKCVLSILEVNRNERFGNKKQKMNSCCL